MARATNRWIDFVRQSLRSRQGVTQCTDKEGWRLLSLYFDWDKIIATFVVVVVAVILFQFNPNCNSFINFNNLDFNPLPSNFKRKIYWTFVGKTLPKLQSVCLSMFSIGFFSVYLVIVTVKLIDILCILFGTSFYSIKNAFSFSKIFITFSEILYVFSVQSISGLILG